MRKKSKLRFASERQSKLRRTRTFVVSFAAFILVFGAISLLIFMHSLDFDLGNLTKKPEDLANTTAPSSTEVPVQTQVLDSNVLLICSDSNDRLLLLALVSSEKTARQISVSLLDPSYSDASASVLSERYKNGGIAGLKAAVSDVYGVSIDRYIRVTEVNLKKIVSEIGDISVEVPEPIQYRGEDYSLFLDSGEQSLTGDLFVKYLKYASQTGKAQAARALVSATLHAFRDDNRDNLYSKLFNWSDTDISVVDNAVTGGIVSTYLILRDNVVLSSVETIRNGEDT